MTEQTQVQHIAAAHTLQSQPGGRAIGMLLVIIIVAGGIGYAVLSQQERLVEPVQGAVQSTGRGLNLLMITVHALRKDHLGCYGGKGTDTPAIDALAAGGLRFAHAVTAVPIARPSVATIMTGLYPPRHGVRDNGPFRLDDSHVTLAELLKAGGYATSAFVGSFLLDSRYGLNQGFDVYSDDMAGALRSRTTDMDVPHRRGEEVVGAAIDWLDQYHKQAKTMPFFLWVDLFDAQSTYAPPEPFASRYPRQPYRRKVAYVDQQVGRLTEALSKRSLGDKTLVLLIGTHGQSLGEHLENGHGLLLYEPTVSVPMIWHCPPLLGDPKVETQHLVSTVDVVPSVLAILGISAGSVKDGTSAIDHPRDAGEAVYIESLAPRLRHGWNPLFAYRRLADKVIHASVPEYYNLADDPKESKNLYAEASVRASELHSALQKHLKTLGGDAWKNATDETPFKASAEQLAQLGYTLPTPAQTGARPDPNKVMAASEQAQIGSYLFKTGRLGEAIGQFEGALQIWPEDGALMGFYGKVLFAVGAEDASLAAFMSAVRFQPRERHWVDLARAFVRRGEFHAMDVALKQMAELDPADGGISLARGIAALSQGLSDDALKFFEHARSVDPSRSAADAYALAGDVFLATQQLEPARESYRSALSHDRKHIIALEGLAGLAQQEGNVASQIRQMEQLSAVRPGMILYVNTLAQLYIRLERGDDAIKVMKRYIAQNPDEVAALGSLGNVYSSLGQMRKAVETYTKVIELAPDYVVPRFNLGDTLAFLEDVDGALEQYRHVVRLSPKHAKTYVRMLKLLVKNERLDEAFKVLEQAAANGAVDQSLFAYDDEMAALVGSPRFAEILSRSSKSEP